MNDELKLLLDEWKALSAAATPGPWSHHSFGRGGDLEPSSIAIHTGSFDWTDLASEDSESAVAWMPCADSQPDNDAAFITASRTLVPRLIAAVEAVLAEGGTTDPDRWDLWESWDRGYNTALSDVEDLIRAALIGDDHE